MDLVICFVLVELAILYFKNIGSVESRSMDMSREFSPYEFGDIAWKERLDSWKSKQEKMQMIEGHAGGGEVDDNGQNVDATL